MKILFLKISLIGYIIECLNQYTVLENPLDTPLLDLMNASSKNSCINSVIRFTKNSQPSPFINNPTPPIIG